MVEQRPPLARGRHHLHEEIVEEVAETIALIGGQVDAFSNPVKCIEYLKTHRHSYNVLIVDLSMPLINGLDFLKLASPYIANSPRQFLMTGLAELGGKQVESNSMLTVLHKPISISELREKVGHRLRFG